MDSASDGTIIGDLPAVIEGNVPLVDDAIRGKAAHLSTAGYLDLGNLRQECMGNSIYCPQGFTIAFWIKIFPDNDRASEYYLSSGGQTGSSYGVAILRRPSEDQVELMVTTHTESFNKPRIYLYPDTWHHVIVKWSESFLTVFLNGTMTYRQNSGVQRNPPVSTSPHNNMYLGRPNNDLGTTYAGTCYIDDLHFWSEAKDIAFLRAFTEEYFNLGKYLIVLFVT